MWPKSSGSARPAHPLPALSDTGVQVKGCRSSRGAGHGGRKELCHGAARLQGRRLLPGSTGSPQHRKITNVGRSFLRAARIPFAKEISRLDQEPHQPGMCWCCDTCPEQLCPRPPAPPAAPVAGGLVASSPGHPHLWVAQGGDRGTETCWTKGVRGGMAPTCAMAHTPTCVRAQLHTRTQPEGTCTHTHVHAHVGTHTSVHIQAH